MQILAAWKHAAKILMEESFPSGSIYLAISHSLCCKFTTNKITNRLFVDPATGTVAATARSVILRRRISKPDIMLVKIATVFTSDRIPEFCFPWTHNDCPSFTPTNLGVAAIITITYNLGVVNMLSGGKHEPRKKPAPNSKGKRIHTACGRQRPQHRFANLSAL